jgi:transcription factor E
MLDKFLKETMSVVIGKQGEEVVNLLDTKKYINEFLIAKKLNITINQTRNILYKLSDSGLVSSTRKKDKKKGWYTYFWRIEVLKSLQFYREILTKKIEQLQSFVKSRETKQFYTCDRCNVEYNEENALVHNFVCEECGSIFTLKDNKKFIENIKRDLDKLEKLAKLVDEEIQTERDKIGKKREKENKKEEKEKKEVRRVKLEAKRRRVKREKRKDEKARGIVPSKPKKITKKSSKEKKKTKKTKKIKK